MAKKNFVVGAQRLRVIAKGVSFFTNVKQVRDGVGDDRRINAAVEEALERMVEKEVMDIGGYFGGVSVQITIWGDHGMNFKFPNVQKLMV